MQKYFLPTVLVQNETKSLSPVSTGSTAYLFLLTLVRNYIYLITLDVTIKKYMVKIKWVSICLCVKLLHCNLRCNWSCMHLQQEFNLLFKYALCTIFFDFKLLSIHLPGMLKKSIMLWKMQRDILILELSTLWWRHMVFLWYVRQEICIVQITFQSLDTKNTLNFLL